MSDHNSGVSQSLMMRPLAKGKKMRAAMIQLFKRLVPSAIHSDRPHSKGDEQKGALSLG